MRWSLFRNAMSWTSSLMVRWNRAQMPFVCGAFVLEGSTSPIAGESWSAWVSTLPQYSRAPVGPVGRVGRVGQDAQKADTVLRKEGDHAAVRQIRRRDGRLRGGELADRDAGAGIGKGLLTNPAHTLHCSHVTGVLAAQIARMMALDLALCFLLCFLLRFLLGFRLLQRGHLLPSQQEALPGGPSLKRFFMVSRSLRSRIDRMPGDDTMIPLCCNSRLARF